MNSEKYFGSTFHWMLRLAAWPDPVVREILTRWAQLDLGGDSPVTVNHTIWDTQMATGEKASWH